MATGLVTLTSPLALILLSGSVARVTRGYFERRPWMQREKRKTT